MAHMVHVSHSRVLGPGGQWRPHATAFKAKDHARISLRQGEKRHCTGEMVLAYVQQSALLVLASHILHVLLRDDDKE